MVTQAELRSIPLPDKTNSYCPVPNGTLIDAVMEAADKKGFQLFNEKWNTTRTNEIMHGTLIFRGDVPGIDMQVGLLNSYNKSTPAVISVGSSVFVCTNGVVSGAFKLKRRHTINVWDDLNNLINEGIDGLYDEYQKDIALRDRLIQMPYSKREMAEMTGRLFIEENILTPNMVSVVKKEIVTPTFEDFQPENVWSFYNHCTYALKDSHPSLYIENHTNFHNFMETSFN